MSLASLPTALIVPPLNCLVAACLGALFRRRRAGRVLLGVGLSGLAVLSLPLVANSLLAALDPPPAPDPGEMPPAAIVILSGDETRAMEDGAAHYGVGGLTLQRERAGAALARRTGLPVLVSGGVIHPGAPALAALMTASMEADFATHVRWQEARSRDTWENAAMSAAMLRADGIGSVYVVTNGWHMRRALIAFRHAGLRAVAAPAGRDPWPELDGDSLVPSARAWLVSYYALHEWIGCAWYALAR